MIQSRPEAIVQRGPAPLSDDRFDKFIAAMNWHVGRTKGAEFARAPHYYAALAEWFDRLSLDQQETVYIVHHIDTTPSYGGEAVAIT